MCKAEREKMTLPIQKFNIKGLNRRVNITKHWPTTIWWLDHMTMLNACAEAHAFATLMLYWQQDSKTYTKNLSSLKTTWVDSENIQPLKSEDIWLEWEVYKKNYWSKIMCKAEWQKMRLAIWKFIIKTLSNKGLNRRMSVTITKHRPTTIWWLNHMTMLKACTEAHAFATLMLWKC